MSKTTISIILTALSCGVSSLRNLADAEVVELGVVEVIDAAVVDGVSVVVLFSADKSNVSELSWAKIS